MTLTLSNGQQVELKNQLGWWDLEDIKAQWKAIGKYENVQSKTVAMSIQADAIKQITLKLWSLAIVSIKDGEKTVPFAETWLRTLSKADGDALNTEIEKLADGVFEAPKKSQ